MRFSNNIPNVTEPRKGVNKKEYQDFAHVTEDGFVVNKSAEDSEDTAKKDKNFPVRLHYMLNEAEKDGLQHIVSWQPHGRCFVVRDKKLFTECFLPLWFRQTKFASYQRQLNIYGFNRISSGPDKGGYYHELFLRGKQFLAQGIRRVEIKGEGRRKVRTSKHSLDLYQLPFLPDYKCAPPPSAQCNLVSPGRNSRQDKASDQFVAASDDESVQRLSSEGNDHTLDHHHPHGDWMPMGNVGPSFFGGTPHHQPHADFRGHLPHHSFPSDAMMVNRPNINNDCCNLIKATTMALEATVERMSRWDVHG